MDDSLTNQQRIEAIRRLEASQQPEARVILEGLDRLLSGEDVGWVMDGLAESLLLFQRNIERATKTEPIIGYSSINGGARRKYVIENPNTRNARVREIDKDRH